MIRNPKDFWSGVLYSLVGSIALIVGRDYGMGTALKMGAAYFPSLLGGLLILVGLVSVLRSFLVPGEPIGAFALKKVILIVASVIVFGFIVRGLGLAIALPLLTVMSACASSRFRWGPTIAMASGLTIFCILVFVKGLGVPLPLIGSWIVD